MKLKSLVESETEIESKPSLDQPAVTFVQKSRNRVAHNKISKPTQLQTYINRTTPKRHGLISANVDHLAKNVETRKTKRSVQKIMKPWVPRSKPVARVLKKIAQNIIPEKKIIKS